MDERTQASKRLQRRGLMAGVAALVGAGIAKVLSAGRAEAGHDTATAYSAANVMHLGVINDGGNAANDESATNITARTALVASTTGFQVSALRVRNLGTAGRALEAVAGPGGTSGVGGTGVSATGGSVSAGGSGGGGTGVQAQGGNADTNSGGVGLDGDGGNSVSGDGGPGVQGAGGDGRGQGGVGTFGRGGNGATGGPGVLGVGGRSISGGSVVLGSDGSGVEGETDSDLRAGVRGSNSGAGLGVLGTSRSATQAGVKGQNLQGGPGVLGQTAFPGLSNPSSGPGVRGESRHSPGVEGVAIDPASGTGVRGEGRTVGVVGQSGATGNGSGTGVHGDASDTAASAIGVLGTGYLGVFGNAAQFGVYGFATGAGAQGFHAEAPAGVGLVAVGQQGLITEGTGALGLEARCASGTAVLAVSSSLAGRFIGHVLIEGNHTITGVKSAAVPHPDGSHRRLYCEESTESWFSDYGEGRLVNGRAEVRLDRDFAAVVRGDRYSVFPVPEGDCNGLYVSSKSPTGFEVRELKGGTSTLAFTYRVVAKRRDIEGPRLERVPMPAPPGRPRIEGIERPQDRGRSSR
jgi:hypothetical protein